MARNGSGSYSNPYPNFVSGTVISSSEVDANNSDIATALTQSIAVDGQSTVTGNIPLSTNKLTGVGAGSAATDSLNLGQAQAEAMHWCGTAGGSANAITLSPSPAITAYAAGQRFVWKASGSANTGATTVAISGLGTIALQDNGAALVAGNHAAGKVYMGILDTTSTMQVLQVQISGTDPLLVSSLTVSGDALIGDDLTLNSDAAILGFGENTDVTLTHVHDTGLLLNSTRQLQFGDSGTYIHQSADGVLDLVSDTEIEINATTIDINGAVALDGAITGATNITLSGELDAATLDISGNADIDGTTNLDAVDIDGAVQIDATLSVGVDGTGYDVTFFGDNAGRYVKWDESADSLLFSDNAKAVFGQPGNDLQIVHDTNNSFITDAGTGNLYLDSNAGNIYLRVNASENALEAVQNSGVTLYHNGDPKIATVAGGVNVTGGTTSVGTGGVTIDATAGADANPELELTAVARQFNIGVGGATFATTAIRGSYYIYDATATAYRFTINSGGYAGINTQAPGAPLEVFTASTTIGLRINRYGSGVYYSDIIQTSSPERLAFKVGDGSAIAERMAITAAGAVTIPNQPAFLVHPSARINDVTGDATAYTAVWNTEIFDQGGNFASNTFTAPVTGKYQFNVNISLLGIVSGHTNCIITLVTSNRSIRTHFKANVFAQTGSGDQNSFNGSVLADMDTSDTAHVTITVAGGSKVVDFDGDSNLASTFSGSLIA
jgi:hypothetical protein